MRIRISYKGKCLTLAHFRASKNSIVTWYMPKYHNERLMKGLVHNMDFHFTYPRDGNMHCSYKYFDPDDSMWYEKRVYHDRFVIKSANKDKTNWKVKSEDRSDSDILQHLVLRKKGDALNTPSLMFAFPQSGIGIGEEFLSEIIDGCNNSGNDLVLDVEPFKGKTLNFGFLLYGSDRKSSIMGGVSGNKFILQTEVMDGATMEGYISVVG